MGPIQGLGWLFSGVLKFFPGLPTIAVYALAVLAVVGLPAGYAWHKGNEGAAAAVAQCKSACSLKIADMQTAAERTISDILSSVNEQGQESENVADYCKSNPGLCRSDG